MDQDWQRAATLAAAGENAAPAGTGAAVQLAAQSARAAARLGDGPTVRAALDRTARKIATQSSDRPSDHHFAFDARKFDYYVATALAWLGDPAGERHAREIVEQYSPTGAPRRLATARLDLGLILARDRRPDEAAELGILAVDSQWLVPSNAWRAVELDEALSGHRDIERWRRFAVLQTDPVAYRRTMRRAAELATEEPSPEDEPLEVTCAKAGL